MISHRQYGFDQDTRFQTVDADAEGATTPLIVAVSYADQPDSGPVATLSSGMHLPSADMAIILLALLVMMYAFARWLRRRNRARNGGDFQLDRKLDPALIRVFGISGKQ